jgi:hypothetical protein
MASPSRLGAPPPEGGYGVAEGTLRVSWQGRQAGWQADPSSMLAFQNFPFGAALLGP